MTETIDLTPQGMRTQEGIQRVNTHVERFEHATSALADAASEFFDDHHVTLLELARGSDVGSSDRQALHEALRQLGTVVGARRREQEELLRAVAGHPPLPSTSA